MSQRLWGDPPSGAIQDLQTPGAYYNWGNTVVVPGTTQRPADQIINVVKLQIPVTMCLQLATNPDTPSPVWIVKWGSYGKLLEFRLRNGTHVVFGDTLLVWTPAINNVTSADPVIAVGVAAVCFSQPNWDGDLVPPTVGQ